MKVRIDYTDKSKSLYQCDRCGHVGGNEDNYNICVQGSNDKGAKKKWDLCKKCYCMLVKGIEKQQKNCK